MGTQLIVWLDLFSSLNTLDQAAEMATGSGVVCLDGTQQNLQNARSAFIATKIAYLHQGRRPDSNLCARPKPQEHRRMASSETDGLTVLTGKDDQRKTVVSRSLVDRIVVSNLAKNLASCVDDTELFESPVNTGRGRFSETAARLRYHAGSLEYERRVRRAEEIVLYDTVLQLGEVVANNQLHVEEAATARQYVAQCAEARRRGRDLPIQTASQLRDTRETLAEFARLFEAPKR